MTDDKQQLNSLELADFLQEARERYDFGRTADAPDREAGEYDNKFANADNKNLDQWDAAAKRARKKRPVVQWNRVHVSIQQVVNDGRQNKPSIQINPGDGGKLETAEYFRARIRHIEYESNVDTAKDCARDQQVTSGRGFIRVRTEYVPGSNKQRQRICVDRIENQFSVVFDPGGISYDRSDADWCFVVSLITRDAHKRKYGPKSLVNQMDFADACNLAPDWVGIGDKGEMIQIAEYYVREYDEAGDVKCVKQYVINGAEILKETEWLGSTIPIVPFWGREATIDGQRRTFSLTRAAIFPQQMLNIYVSNLAELVGQMPKAPWAVPVDGIPASQEQVYANVNNNPVAYLLYNSYDSQGRPIPRPDRITAEPPIQACIEGINQCIDAIKASMGIYDAAMGAKSNETSGVAIERRRKQSNITNYHFADNEARSNKYLGEILVEILPLIDLPGSRNPTRTEDGKTNVIPVGELHQDPKTGKEVIHDLRSGQYGVTVSQGPSNESARQEQYDRDAALVQADPTLLWVIGDQMFAADDSEGSQDRAERMRRAIQMKTPGLIQDKTQQADPQQLQQQLQAKDQQLQQVQAFAQSLHEQIATKQVEAENAKQLKQMELQFKYEELAEKSRVELAKLGVQSDIVRLEAEIEVMKHQAGLQASADAQMAQHGHEDAQQDASAQQAAQMADQGHANALEAQDHAAELQPQEPGGEE